MKIVDWEVFQLYRNLRKKHGDDLNTIEYKIKKKWFEEMFSPSRDSYFYVGNTRKYPNSFIILGVFWPPK